MVDIVVTNPSRPAAEAMGVGVSKAVLTLYEGMLQSHSSVLCYRAPGATGAEDRGPYRTTEPGEPMRSVTKDAHSAGQEVHPYALVGIAGVWMGSRRARPRARMRLGSIPKFAMEHPEYMSRARDGTSWFDWEIGESPLGYDVGYLGLAYPEVREYQRAAFISYVDDFDADGVQMEFVQVLAEGDDVWPLGYDAPAIAAYKEQHGVDPIDVDATDEAWARLSPNPPKDTDGRREGSGRGWVRELQGRWPGVLG